jgi:diguanylate cyclase (GGDEF)-like protein
MIGIFRLDLDRLSKIAYLTKMNRQLSYVDQLTQAIRKTMKIEEVLELIMKNLVDELGYDRVIIYGMEIGEKNKSLLKVISSFGIQKEKIEGVTFKLDRGLDVVPRAAVDKKPYIIKNAAEDHRCSQEYIELLDLKEYIVLPLIAKDIIVGVLLADNYTNKKPIEEDSLYPLSMFANQVALAIENAKLYERVEKLAITDGLTNIYNHRYFQDIFRYELNRLERYSSETGIIGLMSLIMIDVDHFKNYNDTNGHPAGDVVLIEVGQILKECTRKVDLVARYGGEEFIVMLPYTTKRGAVALAERIRSKVENQPFEFAKNQPGGKLTISVGVATYRNDGKTSEEIIKVADQGLYKAKSEGRNRVCYVNPPDPSEPEFSTPRKQEGTEDRKVDSEKQ